MNAKESIPKMSSDAIYIEKLNTETLLIPIVGTAPLIVHRFTEKAKREMWDNIQKKRKVKMPRNAADEYKSSLYRIENKDGSEGYGFPAIAFKAATVGAARFYGKAIPMTQLRQFMFFKGILTPGDPQQLVPIEGEPRMREDVVTVGRGTDLRYRAEFLEWRAVLEVRYVATSLARDSVLSLVDAGGMGVGVGEWRPQKNGDFGTYAIDVERGVEIVG